MNEAFVWLAVAVTCLVGVAMIVAAALKGWQGWLELRRCQLGQPIRWSSAERIALADLRERVRSLEAIAACIDP